MANVQKISPEKMPVCGDYATHFVGSDRYPYEVVYVSKSGKMVHLRPLNYRRIDDNGLSETQEYEYTQTEGGATMKATMHKDGKYHAVGTSGVVTLNGARAYFDPSF